MQHPEVGEDGRISTKHRVTVNLEDAEYRALKQVAAKADRSLAWLGRQAIRDLLQRESAQLTLDFTDQNTFPERSSAE